MSAKYTMFVYEKSTKNMHRFNEEPPDGAAPIIGSLYVSKWAIPNTGPNTKLKVTVEVMALPEIK